MAKIFHLAYSDLHVWFLICDKDEYKAQGFSLHDPFQAGHTSAGFDSRPSAGP